MTSGATTVQKLWDREQDTENQHAEGINHLTVYRMCWK